ncbi:uncharacterized protein LOC134528486 [Bacillus rossius redtenbacheri]|uniref:uncharacterized protein LOC134528486 n=1 Tax=Bacillus rossius redtenbacheri TaxID=93214 RepID=UPI002FDDC155
MTAAAMLAAAALLAAAYAAPDLTTDLSRPATLETSTEGRANKKFGDRCDEDDECSFGGAMCDKEKKMCQCLPELDVTDHVDKCGKAALVNEECIMSEQCVVTPGTECVDGFCRCSGELRPVASKAGVLECKVRGLKQIGDKCVETQECGFDYAVCDANKKCRCMPDYPVTNHFDKCGKERRINESCDFTEQCEQVNYQTQCRDGRCMCRFELTPVLKPDGSVGCVASNTQADNSRYIDPAMIGVLVGMALMFIILCVVLRLFSKARWRENRTIFNTPNPRLMNVSLLRDSKLLHSDQRRGSRSSVRAPSRQPSMASLRPHSPTASQGSRRGSKTSSNASATSTRSPKSPLRHPVNSTDAAPTVEKVTVERNAKA